MKISPPLTRPWTEIVDKWHVGEQVLRRVVSETPAFFMWQKYPTSWREAWMMSQKYKWIFSYVWLRSLSKNNWKSLSHVWLFVTPWTTAHQAPLSTGFPRREYYSGLPFPSPCDLPDAGMEPESFALQADFFFFYTIRATREAPEEETPTYKPCQIYNW